MQAPGKIRISLKAGALSFIGLMVLTGIFTGGSFFIPFAFGLTGGAMNVSGDAISLIEMLKSKNLEWKRRVIPVVALVDASAILAIIFAYYGQILFLGLFIASFIFGLARMLNRRSQIAKIVANER